MQPLTAIPTATLSIDTVLATRARIAARRAAVYAFAALCIVAALALADAFDLARYRDAMRPLWSLAVDAFPPDFSRATHWARPLLDTLTMSIAGTALGCLLALPLAPLAARTSTRPMLGLAVRFALNVLRSVPGVIWGVLFVAAVGFGPLPGVLALATHSTGMLGKLYAEVLEHVDPAPGAALRSHGVSRLGVLRFSVLPQVLPRLLDVSFYRWEHNVRAATVLGLVGAGGLGLEITTAFHLFEYREASALILVVIALVGFINLLGARVRARLLALDAQRDAGPNQASPA